MSDQPSPKPRTGPLLPAHLPPGTMSDRERRQYVETAMRQGSLFERGIVVGLDLAIQIVLRHIDNPLPFLEDELKRRVKV